MPPKRRSSGPVTSSSKPSSAQSTLSFNPKKPNRVTKPSSSTSLSKAKALNQSKKDPALFESITETSLPATASPEPSAPTTSELAIQSQAAAQKDDLQARKAEKRLSKEEEAAERVTEAQLKAYWRKKEEQRKAPRVHQEGLGLHEKILREFDMSGQFGPCIGISRMKRWKRAQNLGLKPPVEILAVLLKEQAKENTRAERAYVDELMSSRFIET